MGNEDVQKSNLQFMICRRMICFMIRHSIIIFCIYIGPPNIGNGTTGTPDGCLNMKSPQKLPLEYLHGRWTVLQKFRWCQVGHISLPCIFSRAFTCLLQLRQAEKARCDNGMCFSLRIQSPIEVQWLKKLFQCLAIL